MEEFRASRFATVSRSQTHQQFPDLSLMIPLLRTNTNTVIRVVAINGTDLAESASLKGPWFRLYTTNWAATNPAASRFFRAVGKNSRVEISQEWK